MRVIVLVLVFFLNELYADPCIWQVSYKDKTMHLLGSLHVLSANPQFPNTVVEPFEKADIVIFETDIREAMGSKILFYFAKHGFLKGEQTLKNVLSQDMWQNLEQSLQQLDININTVENYRPWLLALTLTTLILEKYGYKVEYGVDQVLFQKSIDADKNLIFLETFEQQLDLLSKMKQTFEIAMLQETLDEISTIKAIMAKLEKAWWKGDLEQLSILMMETITNIPVLKEDILFKRNLAWSEQLDKLLKESEQKHIFVVVGAAHLIGENSVPKLLKAKDYSVYISCHNKQVF